MTNPDPEREERKGVDQVKKEQNGQSTTTVIKVTETYPKAGTEAFIVKMTSILTQSYTVGEQSARAFQFFTMLLNWYASERLQEKCI